MFLELFAMLFHSRMYKYFFFREHIQNKWTKTETNILVSMWKENLSDIESSKANVIGPKLNLKLTSTVQ